MEDGRKSSDEKDPVFNAHFAMMMVIVMDSLCWLLSMFLLLLLPTICLAMIR